MTPPLALLDDPLEYILVDNFRHRLVCSALCRCADNRQASGAEAGILTTFFMHDLVLHKVDEQKDLFPTLLRRALPEDGIEVVLAGLGEDDRRCEVMLEGIIKAISCRDDEVVAISAESGDAFRAYAARTRRHLATENCIVLPIARIRLKRADLDAISRAMKDRRGIAH